MQANNFEGSQLHIGRFKPETGGDLMGEGLLPPNYRISQNLIFYYPEKTEDCMQNASEEFSTFDVQKILGINRNRLKVWIDSGFIKPSNQKKIGTGLMAIFNREDLCKIQLFLDLVDFGFNRKSAAEIIKKINPSVGGEYYIGSHICLTVDMSNIQNKVGLQITEAEA